MRSQKSTTTTNAVKGNTDEMMKGGYFTDNYTDFVQKLFTPRTGQLSLRNTLDKYYDDNITISASPLQQLKVDMILDSSSNSPLYVPLEIEKLLKEGIKCSQDYVGSHFEVYQPKSSPEYFSTMHRKPITSSKNYDLAKSSVLNSKSAPDFQSTSYSATKKPILVDYKSFPSPPLSPYFYLNHKYVGKEDTRIVGSEFVLLNLRKNDNFLQKTDETLRKAREINPWNA
ncbi:putative RNA-binding protein [Trichinella spiralis]|uniref:Uncharacterized protein n=4 Tax=Trichinella spiralis TaxID=6334 RepID=E5S9E8_TRISP|nr:conserved hypothetical protein [Trichinella spiralis]KRY40258.1 hypothetical protein T01_14655 [Trichinella spiralis]